MFNKKILPFLFLIFSLFSCKGQVQNKAFDALLQSMLKKDVALITVPQLAKELQQPNKLVLLDAREKKEFEVSHLKNAQWVGYDTFTMDAVKKLPKNTPIVIYCSIGMRSEIIGEKLKKAGYQDVRNLYGSIFEWVNQGNTVYDLAGKPTSKVHAYDKTWGIWLTKGEKIY